ncbi:hypothetical protein [uncultured Helicobacter sp.]
MVEKTVPNTRKILQQLDIVYKKYNKNQRKLKALRNMENLHR